jgi:hypothetical protein
LTLLGPTVELGGSGTVDFNRTLDFRLGVFPNAATAHNPHPPYAPIAAYRITGPLSTPQIGRATPRTASP